MKYGDGQQWSATDVHVPPSLLAGVMSRIEQQEAHVQRMQSLSLSRCIQLLSHPQWEMRVAALEALEVYTDQLPIEPIILALHDEHELVRVAAVKLLGCLGETVPLEQLVMALQDRTWQVREMAVLQLGELYATREAFVKPLLKAASLDVHSTVRASALAALEQHAELTPEMVTLKGHSMSVWHRSLALGNLHRTVQHSWLVFSKQQALFLSRWKIPALILFLSYALIVFTMLRLDTSSEHRGTTIILALMSILSAALGVAFTTDTRYDDGIEIALSTPTPVRLIMFSRFLLVMSINMLLATSSSLLMALLYHQSTWAIMQLWLGPLCIVSAFILMLTLMLGSWISCLLIALFGIFQAQQPETYSQLFLLQIGPQWQIGLIILFLACAFVYAPRQTSQLNARE